MVLNVDDWKGIKRDFEHGDTPMPMPIDTVYHEEGIPAESRPATGITIKMPPTDNGTTGLETSDIAGISIETHVIPYLNRLNFNNYVPEYYDCEDRAFWGMAHVRAKFIGCPVGVITGIASVGENEKRHAMIILWEKTGGEYKRIYYYSPQPSASNGKYEGVIDESKFRPRSWPFSVVKSIISFPKGPNTTPPVHKLDPLKGILMYDKKRMIYNRDTVFNYLENRLYKKGEVHACEEDHEAHNPGDYDIYWKDYDNALWAFAHARRAFPGIPLGVAMGTPVDGISSSVIILWYNENNQVNKPLVFSYWDPAKNDVVSDFKPLVIG